MKAQSRRLDYNSNQSVATGPRGLRTFAAEIIKTDPTPEAIARRVLGLRLTDSESIGVVDFLNEKAQRMLYGEHPVRMLEVSQRAFLLAHHLGYEKGKAYGLLFVGVSEWFISNLGESLENLLKAKNLFVALDDAEGRMKALLFAACVYRSMGDYDQSYLDLRRAAEFFRKRRDIFWEATALMSLAMTCEQIGDYKGVRRHNRRIIKIIADPDLSWMVGRALDGIGTTYYNSGKYNQALEHYEKSLMLCRKTDHPVGVARALNDIGTVYQQLGDTEKASWYYHESLKIRKEIGQREAQCTCLFNLGQVSLAAGDPESALQYFNEGLATAMAVDAKPRISQAHEYLSRAYEATSDFVNALRHHKLFHKINEEVSTEQSSTRAKNLRTRLELEKAENVAEIERLRNVKLSEQKDELERLLHDLQVAQAQLVQAEKMAALGKLVAGIAHEMNSPIGASTASTDVSERCITKIMQLLESCNSLGEMKSGDRLEQLLGLLSVNNKVVAQANERLSKIVGSLKSFSSLDEATFKETDIHTGLESAITLLEAELSGKVNVTREYGKLPRIPCYPSELNQVFLNLLTNSIEAIHKTDAHGEILIQTSVEDRHIRIKISDNGIGIPPEKLRTLFDPGFAQQRTRVKAGMGLFISQNIVQRHKGNITVVSEVKTGTTFTIVLPVDLDAREERSSSPYTSTS
jgi:signal transduction histidine kinase